MNINKIKIILDVFNKGQAVANPEAWKKGQITTNVIVCFIWALINVSNAYGYNISVDKDFVDGFSIASLTIINWIITIVSSEKIGIVKK